MNAHYKILCLALLFLSSCTFDQEPLIVEPEQLDKVLTDRLIRTSPTGRMDYYILANEFDLEHLPNQDPHNPITYEKVKLGKFLFFETGLAKDALYENCEQTYSCSTCHIPDAGFLPNRIQGIADGAHGFGSGGEKREVQSDYRHEDLDAQGVRPLSTLNVAYVTNTLWSGLFGADHVNVGTEAQWTGPLSSVNKLGFTGLESQNIEGVDLHRLRVDQEVLDSFGYRVLFDAAFPDWDEEHRYGEEAISFALGAYLRTLLTNRAPFQEWLRGDRDQLTDAQKKGALVFFDKARCYLCHRGPSFSAVDFHALGTADLYEVGGLNTSPDDPRNLGRAMFTGRPEDEYRFKVPQLYNLKDYATFFHGSSKTSIAEVVDFKIRGKSEHPAVGNDRLSPLFEPLELTEEERANLIDFLTNALYDAELDRYVPQALPSGNCFPNNDPQSRRDIGCE